MGLIYCIQFSSGKKYIGQTRQPLEKRLIQHLSSKDNTLISRAFNKYSDYECSILIECDNDKLDYYETYFINKFNTISPNGYNLRSGGQNGYYFSDEVKLKCSMKARNNIDDNLPMYVYNSTYGYRCRSPGRNEKYFNYKFLDKETNLKLAIEYINGKDDLYKKYIEPKNLPKFVSRVERDNRSGYRITLPGYEKHFTSMKLSDEEKYNLAISYLNSVMEQVQRLNINGQ